MSRRVGSVLVESESFATVLAAAQSGDEDALALLWRRHHPGILRYLRAHEPQDGDDIATDAWIDAARGLPRFEGAEDAFRGWLFTIARRRLVDHRRRRGRRPSEPLPDADTSGEAAPSAESEALSGSLGDEAAARILALLPAEQAEIVLLRVVADLPVAQVAQITGRSPGHVRVLQHRALRRLASTLSVSQPEEQATPNGA
jgi:RNA polymerase sigma-70 factor (ECF subfamily)